MILPAIVSIAEQPEPLELTELPKPSPGPGEVLLEVLACGVCHTELDEIEGRTAPAALPIVPGHEIVGRVVGLGDGASRYDLGDRVGVGWIHHSTGASDENLAAEFCATGRDVNGG
jgi:propanol-preferring alcohol dehydrogenase